jgi:hypothetical protein
MRATSPSSSFWRPECLPLSYFSSHSLSPSLALRWCLRTSAMADEWSSPPLRPPPSFSTAARHPLLVCKSGHSHGTAGHPHARQCRAAVATEPLPLPPPAAGWARGHGRGGPRSGRVPLLGCPSAASPTGMDRAELILLLCYVKEGGSKMN